MAVAGPYRGTVSGPGNVLLMSGHPDRDRRKASTRGRMLYWGHLRKAFQNLNYRENSYKDFF